MIYNYERLKETSQDVTAIQTEIMHSIKDNEMAPLYQSLCSRFSWNVDETLVKTMKIKNEADVEAIAKKMEDALQNAGDTEVMDCMFEKSRHYLKIGDWEEATKSYDEILKKDKTSVGKKIDAIMEKTRISIFDMDMNKLKELIPEAKRLIELGGDWDRRNRLKVYEAHYWLGLRDLKQAANLLLECIATFTCTELCSYKQFMFYALVTSIISLDRNKLRKQVIDDPQVITLIRELPKVKSLVKGIYECDYKTFFVSILELYPDIMQDRLLGPVATYLVREYRILAYSQFLEAYKSVMLSSMAKSFGISSTLLDAELSRFIAAGRLNAKIDKVGDMIETSRPDKKNAHYQDVIKKGDHLLNQIQKLVRLTDV